MVSLTLNATGAAHAAFYDGMNDLKATVMRYNGKAWETIGIQGFSTGMAYTSINYLILNSAGAPYVYFGNGTNEEKATAMETTFDP